jgi:hypothetical protein
MFARSTRMGDELQEYSPILIGRGESGHRRAKPGHFKLPQKYALSSIFWDGGCGFMGPCAARLRTCVFMLQPDGGTTDNAFPDKASAP